MDALYLLSYGSKTYNVKKGPLHQPLGTTNKESLLEYGAGRRNRTPIIGLEGRGNSHYTIPAWWRVVDSNHRRHSQQIYSLPPLAARETLRFGEAYFIGNDTTVNINFNKNEIFCYFFLLSLKTT